jgi:cytochrome c-type biogenesis protein CcmI
MSIDDALPVVLGVLLVAATAAFALWPLIARRAVPAAAAPANHPGAERSLLYRQVLDLEFDHQTGKLSKADYELLSAELLARAARLLEAARGDAKDLEAELEREIAAARRALASSRPAVAVRERAR